MTAPVLKFESEPAHSLAQEVMDRSGQNLVACYQCRRCAAGCPVGDETEVTPDRLIRMILLGDREGALNNLLVWKCVACYTCGTRCPNEIQTARINETLKQMAKEEHLKPQTPKVAAFHDAFCTAARHLGRVNEIEFMGLYEMKNSMNDAKSMNIKGLFNEALDQAKLGLNMMKKKRMHFKVETVKGRSELKKLYKKSKEKKQEKE